MPVINEIVEGAADWLACQPLDPRPRLITTAATLPAPVYPSIRVAPEMEHLEKGGAQATGRLAIHIAVAAGRQVDAWYGVRMLAHQVRIALNLSHGLGGTVKHLSVNEIRYEGQQGSPGQPVTASAVLTVILKYHAGVLNPC
jgi:hypothetical protein